MRASVRMLLLCAMFAATGQVRAAERAEAVLKALLPCEPAFFETLKADRAAFGKVTVTPHDNPNAAHPAALQVVGSVVTFAAPVKTYGLSLTGYMQATLMQDGKPGTFWWGFEVADRAADVAKAISAASPEVEFRERQGSFGIVHEVDTEWRGPKDGLQTKPPWRILLIEPRGESASVRCAVFHKSEVGMTGLPAIGDLFIVNPWFANVAL